jgi:tRNA(fMet)-specific endonuclease VapC
MVILDTDHVSILDREQGTLAQILKNRLDQFEKSQVVTTIISYEEQTRGWLSLLAQSKKMKEQIQTYGRLNRQLRHFCGYPILDFDERAATEFQRLKKANPRLGTMDLKIAAIAISQNAVLLSRNLRDFQQINGLHVED